MPKEPFLNQYTVDAVATIARAADLANDYLRMMTACLRCAWLDPSSEPLAFGWFTAALHGLDRVPDCLIDSVRLGALLQSALPLVRAMQARTYH